MKKLVKTLLVVGVGTACAITGGLMAPALGAAVGVTGIISKVTGAAAKAVGTEVIEKIEEAKKK